MVHAPVVLSIDAKDWLAFKRSLVPVDAASSWISHEKINQTRAVRQIVSVALIRVCTRWSKRVAAGRILRIEGGELLIEAEVSIRAANQARIAELVFRIGSTEVEAVRSLLFCEIDIQSAVSVRSFIFLVAEDRVPTVEAARITVADAECWDDLLSRGAR